jgi:hypothetical protein
MGGGAEAHSHIAPNYLPLSIPCLFAHTAQDGRSWPSLTAPIEAPPEPILDIVKRRQAFYRLDIDDGRLRRPGRPHGHRRGQDQVVVVAFSPVLVGVVTGCDVDLDAEVQELFAEEFGKHQRRGNLECAGLQGRLQGGDEVPFGHPVGAFFEGLGVPSVDLYRLEGAAAC